MQSTCTTPCRRPSGTCTSTPASLSSRALVAFSTAKTSYIGLGWLPLPLATCSCNGAVLTGVRPQPPAAFLQPPSSRMLALPHSTSTTLARKCFCPHSAELDTLMHMPFSFDIRGWSMSTCTGAGRSCCRSTSTSPSQPSAAACRSCLPDPCRAYSCPLPALACRKLLVTRTGRGFHWS